MMKRCKSLEWDNLLAWIFACVLLCRFLYPFYFNPMDQLWSDPGRHWDNGKYLFSPLYHISSGTDPKTYQVWIYLLRKLAYSDNKSIVALFTGFLCASMPYFWYRALREFCTRRTALSCAILIGVHPSFLPVYGYFMIETIVLTSTALAVWMTFRSVRKKTLSSCIAAIVCWLIAGFSKQTMLPVMCIGMAYLLSFQPRKLPALCWLAGLFILFALPSSWQTYQATGSFSPFGYTGWVNVHRASGYATYAINLLDTKTGLRWYFKYSCPSFYNNPLEPLGKYTTYRIAAPYTVTIDLANGTKDWDKAIMEAEHRHSFYDRLKDIYENVIYFFFSPSWPDSDGHSRQLLPWLNFHLRWMFTSCITVILALTPFARMERHKMLITSIAFVMILLMLFQQTGIMEGRYRKPLEPFILLGTIFIIESLFRRDRDNQTISLREFIIELLTYGLIAGIRNKMRAGARS